VILVSDVTDRKRRERELERQNERLEEFSSVLSHDLRNPLNVADLHVELAREGDGDGHLEAIERSLGRMEDIIDDVLALAREGRTVTEADLQPVGIGSVAERAWAGTPTTNATLEVAETRDVMADSKRLQRAFENLFRNSVEHGSTGSRNEPRSGDSVEHGSPGSRASPEEGVALDSDRAENWELALPVNQRPIRENEDPAALRRKVADSMTEP
jgi:signal transduction histidine kinase